MKHLTKKLSLVVCVVAIMMQVIATNSVFAEYNKEMEKLYGIWGIPNSSYSMEITEDTIAGQGYTIIDVFDNGKRVHAVLGTGDGAVEILSDGKMMIFTMNGEKTKLYKYHRGDDGKLYRK